MKKIIFSLIAVLAMTFTSNAANSYTANDEAVDALIECSTEVAPLGVAGEFAATAPSESNGMLTSSHNNPIASFLLCTFLGGFGVHRHYMGTAKFMWAAYTFTFGGIFGVVPFVDWVMLLIGLVDDDITPYLDNTRFFMWV